MKLYGSQEEVLKSIKIFCDSFSAIKPTDRSYYVRQTIVKHLEVNSIYGALYPVKVSPHLQRNKEFTSKALILAKSIFGVPDNG